MRRTIRESRDQWAMLILAWATVIVLFSACLLQPGHHSYFAMSFAPTAFLLGRLTLQVFRGKAVIDGERIEFDSIYRSRRRNIPIEEIVRYTKIEKHGWAVIAPEKSAFVPIEEPWDFHAAIVEFAPKTLKSKRLRVRRLPPAEDVKNLWMFDFRRPPSGTLAPALLILVLAALFHNAIGFVGSTFLLLILFMLQMNDRLDLIAEGIVHRSPFGNRKIAWAEATAIFCENPKGRRSFVVTAPGRGIHVPAHLARDIEVMRKLIYSLPDEIPCVNFDESTFRGYRRRKKAKTKERAPQEDLLPALTH